MKLMIANIVMMVLLSVSICVTCILASVQMQRLKGMYDKHQDKREFDKELWQLAFDAILVIVQIGIAIAIAILNRWIRGGL